MSRTNFSSVTRSVSEPELALEPVILEANGAAYRLEQGTALVGSSSRSDLVLGDRTVSGRHASFELLPGRVRVRDLESRNGVKFLGARVVSVVVPIGASVTLGKTVVNILRPSDGAMAPASDDWHGLVARSSAMRQLVWRLERVSKLEVPVVLKGPTGVGKEAVARALHAASLRAAGPFVVFSAAGAGGELLESDLYGHIKGAFTGAVGNRAGVLESAHGGTVLLDNVDQLALELQPKLLRFLEHQTFRRVGDSLTRTVSVRVISTTQEGLERAVEQKRLRQDLYYRLASLVLEVPTLALRRDDIIPLVKRMPGADTISPTTLSSLEVRSWPGNVRELRHAVELGLTAGWNVVEPADADGHGLKAARSKVTSAFEAETLRNLLEKHNWNVAAVAREAKLARSHLYTLIQKHRLKRP